MKTTVYVLLAGPSGDLDEIISHVFPSAESAKQWCAILNNGAEVVHIDWQLDTRGNWVSDWMDGAMIFAEEIEL